MMELFGIAMLVGVINGVRVAMQPSKDDPGLMLLAGWWCGFAGTLMAVPLLLLIAAIFI